MNRKIARGLCLLSLTLVSCSQQPDQVASDGADAPTGEPAAHEEPDGPAVAHGDPDHEHAIGGHGTDHNADPHAGHRSHDGVSDQPAHENHEHHTAEAGSDRPASDHSSTREDSGPAELQEVSQQLGAAEVFNRRILPILRSEENSSCTECHFGGVEIRNYIQDDQASTFAALRREGLIDVERPDDSKILQFISRHTDNTEPLLARVREAEFAAFRTWIHAAVRNPELLAAEPGDVQIGSELPLEVIRHMRHDRVLASFVENIWSQVGRCINCHSPERNQRLIKEHGDYISWIHPNDPAGTLQHCVEQGIIDTDDPEKSDLLLKPLAIVEHAGGPKFVIGSQTDRNFRRFLNDYAATVNQEYENTEDLPEPTVHVAVLTGQHLRVVDLPQRFGKKLLRADIHRWEDDRWSESPVGTADNPINGKRRLWQSMVFASAPRDSERGRELVQLEVPSIPAGRYLVRIYIDQRDRSKEDRDYILGETEFYGEVEFEGEWPPGYKPPRIISARDLR